MAELFISCQGTKFWGGGGLGEAETPNFDAGNVARTWETVFFGMVGTETEEGKSIFINEIISSNKIGHEI